MGTSTSTAQFVKKINDAGHATDRHRKATVNTGAFEAKKIMLATASTKGVQPGGKIAGKKWNVSYDIKGTERPVALVRYTGPFHLVNNPTKPHYIAASGLGGSRASRGVAAFQASASRFSGGSARGSFSGGRRNRRGKRAVSFDGKARAYVFHPGTSGKGIFQTARTVAQRTVPPKMADEMSSAWRRVFS